MSTVRDPNTLVKNDIDIHTFDGRKVLVLGAGVSGPGAVRILTALGAEVVVADSRSEALHRLADELGASFSGQLVDLNDAEAYVPGGVDLIVTSPGWRPDSSLLTRAQAADIPVWGDVELAFRVDSAELFGPRRRWIAVTGTNGKTTTTGMLESICQAAGMSVRACGNIGVPITEVLLEVPRIDVLACELSSFQLHWAPSVKPEVGVLLNIAEDHLDWHGSMQAYAQSKAQVLTGRVAIAGLDDEHAAALLKACPATNRVGVTVDSPAAGEMGVADGFLCSRVNFETDQLSAEPQGRTDNGVKPDQGHDAPGRQLVPTSDVRPPGPAGVVDALCAAAAAMSIGATAEEVAVGLQGFTVADHRCSLVEVINGISYVDDSKATNPHAARTSLLSGGSMVWIAGGLLKGADVNPLVLEVAPVLRAAVLIGRDRAQIAAALRRHAPTVPVIELDSGDDGGAEDVDDPQNVMDRVVIEATQMATAGDTVLLAPAAASMDMFVDYGHRGRSFSAAVRRLAGR